MMKKTDGLLLLVNLWGDNSLMVGPQPYSFTNVPFVVKVYSISKHCGLVRRKSAATELVPQYFLLLKRVQLTWTVWVDSLNTRDDGRGQQNIYPAKNTSFHHWLTFFILVAICQMFRFKQAYSQIRGIEPTTEHSTYSYCAISHAHIPIALQSAVFLILILPTWRIWWLLIMPANGRWDLIRRLEG